MQKEKEEEKEGEIAQHCLSICGVCFGAMELICDAGILALGFLLVKVLAYQVNLFSVLN